MFNSYIINKNNLINNIKQVAKQNQNSKICAMVKANAYGVGIEQVVPIINKFVDFYGVACFFEAKKLCKYTNKKILIVGALERKCINQKFSYTCSSLSDVKFLKSLNKKINIHLKVNSGMNRFGFKNFKEFNQALKEIKFSKLNLEGVFTHFATVDKFVDHQFKVFNKYVKVSKQFSFNVIFHADNSGTSVFYNHNLNMVRVGYNLLVGGNGFKPVVSIKSKIVQVNNVLLNERVGYGKKFIATKPTNVAVVPIGYADGFSVRNIGNTIFFKNSYCKILNVCMDCFMLDVSNLKIKKGTNISILNNINSLKDYSNYLGVSEYEVLTCFALIRARRVIC